MSAFIVIELDGNDELGHHHTIDEAAGPQDAIEQFYARYRWDSDEIPTVAVVMLASVFERSGVIR